MPPRWLRQSAGRVGLNVNRDAAVRVRRHAWQRRRVNQVAIDRVTDREITRRLNFDIVDDLATITLAQPARNRIDDQMVSELN